MEPNDDSSIRLKSMWRKNEREKYAHCTSRWNRYFHFIIYMQSAMLLCRLSFFLSFSLSLCLAQSDGIVMINFSGYLTCVDLYFDIFAMFLCFSLGGFNFWFFIHVVCLCNWVEKRTIGPGKKSTNSKLCITFSLTLADNKCYMRLKWKPKKKRKTTKEKRWRYKIGLHRFH